jgi:hypothetical protein
MSAQIASDTRIPFRRPAAGSTRVPGDRQEHDDRCHERPPRMAPERGHAQRRALGRMSAERATCARAVLTRVGCRDEANRYANAP